MAKSLQVRCRLGLVLKPLEMELDYHRTCSTFSTFCFPVQPLPSSRLNGGCYGNFSRGIKVRLPGEVKRAVNPRFLSPRELKAEQSRGAQGRAELRAQSRAEERKPVVISSRRNRSGSRI